MTLKGTQTEKNLLTAFTGESQARNRYTYFASQAKKDGYVQIQSALDTAVGLGESARDYIIGSIVASAYDIRKEYILTTHETGYKLTFGFTQQLIQEADLL